MKTSLLLCLASLLCVSARAQVFRPETINGAVIGGLAGAVIGNNSGDLHHNGARGAAFGAVAGALIGTAVGESRERSDHQGTQAHYRDYSRSRTSVSIGVGYGHGAGYWDDSYCGRTEYAYPRSYSGYGPRHGYNYSYYEPVYSSYYPAPVYPSYYYSEPSYSYRQPSRAASGAVLGGIAGAIIGNNTGHRNGLQGAAIGAGAGLLLGVLADHADRERGEEPVPVYREEPGQQQQQPAPAPAPAAAASAVTQNATVINNYYGSNSSPMATANGLFGR